MLELGALKLEAVRTQLAERAEPAAPVLRRIKALEMSRMW